MTDPSTPPAAPTEASLENARRLVARLSSPVPPARWTALLVVSAGGGLFLASMWATEPGPLPIRTQVAFGLCLVISASWSTLAVRALLRRGRLFASQRVIAATMGLVFSGLFTVLGLAVSLAADRTDQAVYVGLSGASAVAIAAVLVARARRARNELERAYAAVPPR